MRISDWSSDVCSSDLLLVGMIGTADPMEAFKDADVALLVGAMPRGPGMERKDLLLKNAEIFTVQGKALNAVASRNVKVLVVGNPANTNAYIAMKSAPDLDPRNFTALKTGRAAWRERGWQYVSVSVVGDTVKKKRAKQTEI